jgi:DNA-binding NtrC family response regulator
MQHRILLVDDEHDIAMILAEMLKSASFDVDYFTDPALALEHFSKHSPDYSLVLSDIKMSSTDSGIELANAVHQIRPEIAIMLMTAFDTEAYDLPPFIKKEDVIKKPFGKKELLEAVRKQLNIAV